MKEKDITNKIISYINTTYSDTTYLYKRFSNTNEIGKPDITGCHNGLRVEIEVKTPARAKQVSAHQSYYLNKFAKLKCVVGVVTSLEEALELLGINDGRNRGSKMGKD